MFVGMLIFAFFASLFAIPPFMRGTHPDAKFVFFGISGLIALPALLCLREYIKQSYDVFVFQNVLTGAQIAFLADKPKPEVFSLFIEKFKTEIRNRRTITMSHQKTIPEQIKELGKLREDGLLTEEEFTQAKQNLLQSMKKVSIGFSN